MILIVKHDGTRVKYPEINNELKKYLLEEDGIKSIHLDTKDIPHVQGILETRESKGALIELVSTGREENIKVPPQEAARSNSESVLHQSNLGTDYYQTENYEAAIESYKEAIKLDPKNAVYHNNLGVACLKTENYEAAIELYKEAIKLDPKNAVYHNNLGNVYYQTENYEAAIKSYKEAIKLDPKNAVYHNDLGDAYVKTGNYEAAIKSYKEAIKLDPKDAVYHNNLGVACFKTENYEAAIKSYKEAIKLDPKNADYHNNLGVACFKTENYEAAIELYKEAIKLDPKNADYHNNLGDAYVKTGNYEDAIESYKEAIKLDPKNAGYHNNLGVACFKTENYEAAIELYKEAIKLDPKNAVYHNNLGVACFKTENYEAAIKSHKEAIKLDPKNAGYHNNLGTDYFKTGNYQAAIKSYKEAIKLDPKNAVYHNYLGDAYVKTGNYQAAIEQHQEATKLDPKNAGYHNNLGTDYFKTGNYQAAIEQHQEATKLDPKNAGYHNNLGTDYFKTGNYQAAIESFEEAIKLDPKNAGYHNNLGTDYFKTGNYQAAIESFEEAIKLDPKNAGYHNNLGNVYFKTGNYTCAGRSFQEATILDNQNPSFLMNLQEALNALILSKASGSQKLHTSSKDSTSKPDVNTHVEAKSLTPTPEEQNLSKDNYEAAKTLIQDGKLEEARIEIQKAVEKEPKNHEYLYELGRVYHQLYKFEESIKAYQKATECDPQNALYYYSLGVAYSDSNHDEAAIESFEEAIKLDPQNAEYHKRLGEADSKIRKCKDTAKPITPSKALTPLLTKKTEEAEAAKPITPHERHTKGKKAAKPITPPKALTPPPEEKNPGKEDYELGKKLVQDKNFEGAIEQFKKAIEEEPKNSEYMHTLGRAYYELDQFEEAINAYSKAIKLNSTNPHYHNNLGVALEAVGDYEAAAEAYLNAIKRDNKSACFMRNYGDALLHSSDLTIEKQIIALIAYSNAGVVGKELSDLQASIKASKARHCEIDTVLPTTKALEALEVALEGNKYLLHIRFNSGISTECRDTMQRIADKSAILDVTDRSWYYSSEKNNTLREEKYKKIFPENLYSELKQQIKDVWKLVEENGDFEDLLTDIPPDVICPILKRAFESTNIDLVEMKDRIILGIVSSDTEKYHHIISEKKYDFDILKYLGLICNSKHQGKVQFILKKCAPTIEALSDIKITNNSQLSLTKEFLEIERSDSSDLDLFYHFFKVITNQITNVTDLSSLLALSKKKGDLDLGIIILESMVVLESDNPDMAIELAQNYSNLGKYAKSFDSYAKAIDLLVSQITETNRESVIPKLVVACLGLECEQNKCANKHNEMIKTLAKAHKVDVESDDYGNEVVAYIRLNTDSPTSSDSPLSKDGARVSPVSSLDSSAKGGKKKSVKFVDYKVKTEWKINGKEVSADSGYVVQVQGLGHSNCYAAITKDVLERFGAGVQSKFKVAIGKSAAAVGETGVKRFDGIYELKIKGSNGDGDIRLTASNTFKGLNDELLIVFDEAGDHSTVAKASPTFEIEYGASEATAESEELVLALLGEG